jgi:hypothetical protein
VPSPKPKSHSWRFLTENLPAIVSGLARAEFDFIYSAAPTTFDCFLTYLDVAGIRPLLVECPDARQRRSIPAVLLAETLLVRPLFGASSLAELGPVLCTSPAVLQLLGFTAVQIEQGFRANAGRRPFDEEALANWAAGVEGEDWFSHGLRVLERIIAFHPEYFRGATVVVDSKGVYAPAGKGGLPAVELKACTLSLLVEGRALPLVWRLVEKHVGEVTVGKELLAHALPLLVGAGVAELVLDGGYIDGQWLGELHRQFGLRILIRVREDMALSRDALGVATSPGGRWVAPPAWQEAPAPKLKGKPRPLRQVLLVRELTTWEAIGQAVDALVIRDTYPDGTVQYTVVAAIGHQQDDPLALLADWRGRWAIEEFFMIADRYQKLGRLFPCRKGFARTWVHFAFLAYTLLWLFDHYEPPEPLRPPRSGGDIIVITGGYFALLRLGNFVSIILDHNDVWQGRRAEVLARLGMDPSPP